MQSHTVVLFGEAEKGDYRKAYYCESINQLSEFFGNPPAQSLGIHYAVQALLYHRNLIFFRVREEGFSLQDYLAGLQLLENQSVFAQLSAICAPGVGDKELIKAIIPICYIYHSILITNEADLYDYLSH